MQPREPVVHLNSSPSSTSACRHASDLHEVRVRTPNGCEECLKTGDRWVHLRVCMTCGHVGCCDSSPNRHATAHVAESGHPIVRSAEPGEQWLWCYEDQVAFELDDA